MQVQKLRKIGVGFTSDERQDEELHAQSGKASAVIRALHYSVVLKRCCMFVYMLILDKLDLKRILIE